MNQIQLARVLVGNTALSVFVDGEQNRVHLLDLDETGRRTLTNAIDIRFQSAIIETVSTLGNITYQSLLEIVGYEWYLYHTDGYVTTWKQEKGFTHIPLSSDVLYPAFAEVMNQRRAALTLKGGL